MEYKPQNVICQNCSDNFTIEVEDFNFYEKMKVPPPTFCPVCRFVRRYVWRNERSLYKRKSNVPNSQSEIISMFAPESEYTIYDEKYWWSDSWNPLDYGQEYDFSKPFFEQYKELLKKVPIISLSVTNNVNSSFCNSSAEDKGCYMISASGLNENVFYSNRVANTKDSCDVYISDKNQFCYDVSYCNNCFKVYFSSRANDCLESYFLFDCVNCQNCFGCVSLRNKNYNIFNVQYSKEEYTQKIKNFNLGSFKSITKLNEQFQEFLKDFPRRFANNINCVNTTGDNARNSKNAKFCFDGTGVEDGKFLTWVYMGIKDSYDIGAGSGVNVERLYECFDTNFSSQNVLFSGVVNSCYEVRYSWNCNDSSNLFGCYGLRNKEYCILNKQYSKKEYEELIKKILEHMNDMPYIDQNKRIYKYGEFFPIEISPFAYNETIAQEYYPITKEEAGSLGFRWKDKVERNYNIEIKAGDLPDNVEDIQDSILGKVISCIHNGSCNEQCTEAFRIIPQELQFYKKNNLPVPRLCPNCRHYQRLKQRNPLKLWRRTCMCEKDGHINHGAGKCEVEFETSYAPDRPEIVYCEKCYQQEIY